MQAQFDPIIDNWYNHRDKGQAFYVVAIDDYSGVIELQHIDGDVEEVEPSEWGTMDIELINQPEDWTGPIDDIEYDDLGYSETAMSADDHTNALTEHYDDREAWQIEDDDPDRGHNARHEVPLGPEHC